MRLDFVKFIPSSAQDFERLKNDAVIVSNSSKQTLPKTDSSNVKFYSCAILSGPDGNDLRKARAGSDFVAVNGTTSEICAWAANQKVDLLLQPFNSEKNLIDSQTANVLFQNNVFVGIIFAEFLQISGFRRQMLVKNAMQCIKVLQNAGTKILLLSGAKDSSEMRAVNDFSSFGVLLGLSQHDSYKIIRENGKEFTGRLK